MEMIGKVRRMKLREQLSNSEIAKRTGLSRVTFHHIESNPFSAFRSHPVFGIKEPVRFRHLQAS